MKKTAIMAALVSVMMASAAQAGSIKVEGESQTGGAKRDAVKLEVWEGLTGPVGVGFEAKTYLAEGTAGAYSQLVGKVGYALPKIAGFDPVLKGEVGVRSGAVNAEFWGANIELGRALTDKTTATVGYRYRDGFNNQFAKEQRYNVGLSYALDKHLSVGANYYRYNPQTGKDINAVGLSLAKKF